MTLNARLRDQLLHIESLLRQHQHWQETAPHDSAFASDQPFFMDTLEPLEWLQWVLIPRMHQLLDNEMLLPKDFAIAPYYEMALDAAHPLREIILPPLAVLDTFFVGDAT
ncbi:MAG: YqcC family protein [Kluyvera intermedia]